MAAPADPWDTAYTHLVDYHRQHGHINVPKTHRTTTGFDLARWLTRQRRAHTTGTLTDTHTRQLATLDPHWATPPKQRAAQQAWDTAYAHAVDYHRQHGHLDMASRHKTPTGFLLGRWIIMQRVAHRQHALTHDQVQRLEALNIEWTDPALTDDPNYTSAVARTTNAWNNAYQRLLDYITEHGHPHVPANHRTTNGFYLGSWLVTQRHHHRTGRLAQDRIDRLNAAGIDWNPPARIPPKPRPRQPKPAPTPLL